MSNQIEVLSATILLTVATDLVILKTSKSSPMPRVTKDNLDLSFNGASNRGEAYIKENFPGLPYSVINTRVK